MEAACDTNIRQCGQKYQLLSSVIVVDSELKLVDARTGAPLWTGVAFAQQSSSDGGGGLAGALIGAVVSQIVGSIVDNTPKLSTMANTNLVRNPNQGLLPGPYQEDVAL
ncbi:GNA1162 family protein [Spongiibacter thalassae]|uniref:GNA1162 family protein n=1 Tax=Spongiibacter thalassae TaxID=2721624 RepID=UPI0031F4E579